MKPGKRTIGFVINPISGMGGAVGLKGTDNVVREAYRKGAIPRAPARAEIALRAIRGRDLHFLTCSGPMGEESLVKIGDLSYEVVYHPGANTSAYDTKQVCRIFLEREVDIIVFCGGDGTARDIFDAIGRDAPIIGIPAGVKMYSAVFAITPLAAANLILQSDTLPLMDAEVMDVDEEAYRQGKLSTRLYGYSRVPTLPTRRQLCKWVSETGDEEQARKQIAKFICEIMLDDVLYILGAGTTTQEIAAVLGLDKTLLGIDALKAGQIVQRDLDERHLLALLDHYPRAKIILSPIGAQGFVLGRGNQQISPAVMKKVGVENLIVIATPQKLEKTPLLYIDTGDHELDSQFGNSIAVISGYRIAQRKNLVSS
jgi:predicted polyphosphate/ATP-dependent NAD kinase